MVTTIARSSTSINPVSLPAYDKATLQQLQHDYGQSCTKYEQLAEKRLAKSDTIIVSGVGCALRVKNGALMVYPGRTHAEQKQETKMLYRGVHGVTCIILLTDKGLITLDAVKWCQEQEISVLMLDSRGNVIQTLCSEAISNSALKRKQYVSDVAGKISYEIVKRKIIAQSETLKSHPELPGSDNVIQVLTSVIHSLQLFPVYDVDELRLVEARAANAYFSAWVGLAIKWDTAAKRTVPPHWLTVSNRASPLSKNHGGRHAVDVANAILNYSFALLESQVKQALNSQGFDLSAAFLHADKLYRDSLVYDVMDCGLRAKVEHLVLKMLSNTTFAKGDVMSSNTGECKFNPQFARFIAATCRISQEDVNASAKWLKDYLLTV